MLYSNQEYGLRIGIVIIRSFLVFGLKYELYCKRFELDHILGSDKTAWFLCVPLHNGVLQVMPGVSRNPWMTSGGVASSPVVSQQFAVVVIITGSNISILAYIDVELHRVSRYRRRHQCRLFSVATSATAHWLMISIVLTLRYVSRHKKQGR